ncbi:hypothetical protein HZS_26 [Henneguya salminicola]|nr:hypothetical protein HZS_26 [Henneguya salminicola]
MISYETMILNIFKKTKKASQSSVCKLYLDEPFNNSFLLSIEELRIYISTYYPIAKDEWLATNTLSIYKHISELNSAVYTCCNDETCPHMLFGQTVLSWVDEKNRKFKVSAAQYITMCILSIERFITSEVSCPSKFGNLFPSNYISHLQKIYKIVGHNL